VNHLLPKIEESYSHFVIGRFWNDISDRRQVILVFVFGFPPFLQATAGTVLKNYSTNRRYIM
jgi:hypothetical protein